MLSREIFSCLKREFTAPFLQLLLMKIQVIGYKLPSHPVVVITFDICNPQSIHSLYVKSGVI